MIKISEIKSAFIYSGYCLLCGLFLLFYESFGFQLHGSKFSIYVIKELSVFYLMSALLIFQIYIASKEYYIKLLNTLSLVCFVAMFLNPLSDILTLPIQIWILSSIHLFLIILMQIERYYSS